MTSSQENTTRADGSSSWDEYLDDLAATENVDRDRASTAASATAQRRMLDQVAGEEA